MIKTFRRGENSEVPKLDVVQLKIRNKSDFRFTFVEVLCVPTICNLLTKQPLSVMHQIPEFARLEVAEYEVSLPAGILIGIDFYHVFMTGQILKSRLGPVACNTRVGWALSGKIRSSAPDIHCFETHLLRASIEQKDLDNTLRQELDKFWNVERIGSSENSIIDQFQKEIVHDGSRYITKLPFNPDHQELPDSF